MVSSDACFPVDGMVATGGQHGVERRLERLWRVSDSGVGYRSVSGVTENGSETLPDTEGFGGLRRAECLFPVGGLGAPGERANF
jgi:hypothetical protein